MIREFKKDLAASRRAEALPFWPEVYRQAFPDLAEIQTVTDLAKQRLGIDRHIVLKNGKVLDVDEKCRQTDWGDFALEMNHEHVAKDTVCSGSIVHASMHPRDDAGWAFLSLHTDYLAYAVLPLHQAWLFPFQILQRAIDENLERWMANALSKRNGFSWKGSPNPTYITWNLVVPRAALLDAVRDAICVRWSA